MMEDACYKRVCMPPRLRRERADEDWHFQDLWKEHWVMVLSNPPGFVSVPPRQLQEDPRDLVVQRMRCCLPVPAVDELLGVRLKLLVA